MSLPTLLHFEPRTRPQRPMQNYTFSFEHMMAHRTLQGSMSPMGRFSAAPYGPLDPGYNTGDWHQDHQQSHNDVQSVFPGIFGGFGFGLTVLATETLSQLAPAFVMQDYDLESPDAQKWWTFQNHYTHLDAQQVQNSVDFTFPFF